MDKVYIEVQRNRVLAGDELLERVKKFFVERGVKVAGGMALSDGGNGQFRSFCYTNPKDREFVKKCGPTRRPAFQQGHPGRFFLRHYQI